MHVLFFARLRTANMPVVPRLSSTFETPIPSPPSTNLFTSNMAAPEDSPSRKLKLVVFGATGRTGKEVLKQALQKGHHVTAVVRTPEKLSTQ